MFHVIVLGVGVYRSEGEGKDNGGRHKNPRVKVVSLDMHPQDKWQVNMLRHEVRGTYQNVHVNDNSKQQRSKIQLRRTYNTVYKTNLRNPLTIMIKQAFILTKLSPFLHETKKIFIESTRLFYEY